MRLIIDVEWPLGRCCLIALVLLATSRAAFADAMDRPAAEKPQAIVFFGVYTQWYRLNEALLGYDVKICNVDSRRVQDFPAVKDLFRAKLVILSDVSSREFSENQIKQLKSYVERGGSMLVLGGPFTLGVGGFEETGMSDLLPVRIKPFDLKREKTGTRLELAKGASIFSEIRFDESPLVFWIHEVTAKESATVLLTAGQHSVLVTDRFGKGSIAVFAGTPMGAPSQDQLPFWTWKGWPTLLAKCIQTLDSTKVQP